MSCLLYGAQMPPSVATKSMLCMPVFNAHQQVIAVVQAIGKKSADGEHSDSADMTASASTAVAAFTAADETALRALCSHISLDLENVRRAGSAEPDLAQVCRLLKAHGDLAVPTHSSSSNIAAG